MARSPKFLSICAVAGAALVACATTALADGYEYEGKAMPAPEEGRKFTYSFSLWGTSDYVFRGISQSDEDPVLQGAIDFGYGMFYAGAWASGIDFGGSPPFAPGIGADADVEIDWYAGIKPTWGKAEFDFGVIYYTYPGADDSLAELDYVELKAGVSGNLVHNLSAGATVYWSPEYTGQVGESWFFEGTLGYEFHKIWVFTPTIDGLIGYGDIEQLQNYTYWNAGLALAVENITFDFRYWDTDLPGCTSGVFSCDERFVFTVGVSVP